MRKYRRLRGVLLTCILGAFLSLVPTAWLFFRSGSRNGRLEPVHRVVLTAIEAAWLPFLIDPGTTMELTCVDVRPAAAGDSGSTTGTLAVTGRTNHGVQTIPLGTCAIEWTMVDGQWKISTLGGTLGRKPAGH